MDKIIYCWHSHTFRCGHASGEDEEYILAAIKANIKYYGVSDHIFLPNVSQSYVRGDYSCLESYISSFQYLKEKYKKNIDIHIGFEAEYIPEYIDYYKSLLKSKKIEYLILGQHCYYQNNEMHFYRNLPGKLSILKYTDDLIEGMKTGLFLYVAHPDLFMLTYPYWDSISIECAKRIIAAAIKYKIPLEINLNKVRFQGKTTIDNIYSYVYPFMPFWKLVAKSDVKVVVGIDAHSPRHLLEPGIAAIDELIQKTSIKIINDYKPSFLLEKIR